MPSIRERPTPAFLSSNTNFDNVTLAACPFLPKHPKHRTEVPA
jgi:hypothetical protein